MSGIGKLESSPVLIVGAGPVGLSLALALSTYGIIPVIIDKKSGPNSESKGLAVNIDTLFMLEQLNLCSASFQGACEISKLNIYWKNSAFSTINFKHISSRIRNIITLPQKLTETILINALKERGCNVLWETRLEDYSQSINLVEAVIRKSNHSTEIEQYRWLVSCEGKYSSVRPTFEANFSGNNYPVHFVLGDFPLNSSLSRDQVYYFVFDEVFIIFVPIDETRWRIVVKGEGSPKEGDQDIGCIIETAVTRYLGSQFELGEPLWLSSAPFYFRICDKLHDRRVFLAGDAAHLFSPIGGSGMNTGIHDAIELAWRLSFQEKGFSQPSLLGEYESIRLASIQKAGDSADHLTQLICRIKKSPSAYQTFLPKFCNRGYLRSIPKLFSGTLRSDRAYNSIDGEDLVVRSEGELYLQRKEISDLLRRKDTNPVSDSLLCIAAIDNRDSEINLKLLFDLSCLQQRYCLFLKVIIFFQRENDSGNIVSHSNITQIKATAETIRFYELPNDSLSLVYPNCIIGYSETTKHPSRLDEYMVRYFNSCEGTSEVSLRASPA